MSDRLSTTDPGLSNRLSTADSALRTRAATMAAQSATALSGLDRDQRYIALPKNDLPGLRLLAEELDNEYFNLQDKLDLGQSSESSVEAAFGMARSSSALVFLADGDIRESVYEALSSVPDPAAILALIDQALAQST